MKKVDISGLERHRSFNLRIGFAAALSIAILAFNWTGQRPAPVTFQDDYTQDEAEVKVVRTAQEKPSIKPPPSVFKITDKIVELPGIAFDPNPVSIQVDSLFFNPAFEPVSGLNGSVNTSSPLPLPEEKIRDVFKVVEEMPRFPGCEQEGLSKKEKQDCATDRLLRFLKENIRYPAIARNNGIEGMVVVRFVVEKDGSITGATVVRDIGGGCGAEALRVTNSMPAWIPGKQQGRTVRVQYNLPVKFKLGG